MSRRIGSGHVVGNTAKINDLRGNDRGRMPGQKYKLVGLGGYSDPRRCEVTVNIEEVPKVDRKLRSEYPQGVRFWADFDNVRFNGKTLDEVERKLQAAFIKVDEREWKRYILIAMDPKSEDSDEEQSAGLNLSYSYFEATHEPGHADAVHRNAKPEGSDAEAHIDRGWPSELTRDRRDYDKRVYSYLPDEPEHRQALQQITAQLALLASRVEKLFHQRVIKATLERVLTGAGKLLPTYDESTRRRTDKA